MNVGSPSVGSIVRTPDKLLWRIQMVGGAGGSVRYVCIPLDRAVKEKRYLGESDFTVVAQKG